MTPMIASALWLGDPLATVVAWGSAGVLAWILVAALVGTLLGLAAHSGESHADARRSA